LNPFFPIAIGRKGFFSKKKRSRVNNKINVEFKNMIFAKYILGQYLIFSIVALLFSCAIFATDNPDFPNKLVHLFYYYFGSHLAYWALYVLFSLQLMFLSKLKGSISNYNAMLFFVLILAGILKCSMCTISAIKDQTFSPLIGCSIGFAFGLAGYHLYIHGKEIQSFKSKKMY